MFAFSVPRPCPPEVFKAIYDNTLQNVLKIQRLISDFAIVRNAFSPLLSLDLVSASEDKPYDHNATTGTKLHAKTDSITHDEAWGSRARVNLARSDAGNIGNGDHQGQANTSLVIRFDVVRNPSNQQSIICVDWKRMISQTDIRSKIR